MLLSKLEGFKGGFAAAFVYGTFEAHPTSGTMPPFRRKSPT